LRRRAGRFGLDILLINVWESADAAWEAQNFCDIWGITGTVLLDETGDYTRRLGIRGVPTNVFVDADGTVREVGATAKPALYRATAELLGIPERELSD
jgi:hypothetical protein